MRYREVGLLAEGGMALIAEALRDDGATVVVKRVRPPFCFDPSFLRLFRDEGAVHAALDHENIVRLLDSGEDEGGPYLVFEHVDGTDLGVVLEGVWTAGAPLDVACALAVSIPLFRALAAAHEAKDDAGECLCVVHRDVSPGNVLIACDGGVKLADFGVASFTLKTEATVAGEMKGKFAYMAPEQTRGEKVGVRADLFAAGIVLWECLAGKKLFDAPTDADVVAAVRTADAPSLDAVHPGLPPALVALVAKLLAKDPALRPGTAREVADQLSAIAVELGFDEGLQRHAARLARTAPRQPLMNRSSQPLDGRRRTQRVLGAGAGGERVVRSQPRRNAAVVVGVTVALAAAMAAALASRSDDDRAMIATALPDPTPNPAPIVDADPAADPVSAAPEPAAPVIIAATAATTAAMGRPERDKKKAAAVDAKKAEAPAADAAKTPPADEKRPAGVGKLSISTEPWASVTIDGNLVDKETPLIGFTLAAGRHTVLLQNPVYGLQRTLLIDVPPDGDVKRIIDLNQP